MSEITGISQIPTYIDTCGYTLGRDCCICGKVFDLMDIHDPTTICPECRKRLLNILYLDYY